MMEGSHLIRLSTLQHYNCAYLVTLLSVLVTIHQQVSTPFSLLVSRLPALLSFDSLTSSFMRKQKDPVWTFTSWHGGLALHRAPPVLILHFLDVCMCCLHFLACYLVLDPLQTQFCLHCDTRATFAQVRKDGLWAFFSAHLTLWLTPLLPSFKWGWPSDSSSAPVLPPTLQCELFLNDLTYVMALVMGDKQMTPKFCLQFTGFHMVPNSYSFEISLWIITKTPQTPKCHPWCLPFP